MEWAALCKNMRDAQALFIPKQNEYPDDEQFLEAQTKLEYALKEMEDYRKVVRIAD